MKIPTAPYLKQRELWPRTGRHILAHFDDVSVVVYQAFRPAIGHFAAREGYFGGEFSYSRMSWFKPNFLWMMYRSGWGRKENQEVTLAIRLKRDFFENVLAQCVPSTFQAHLYENEQLWQKEVARSDVRLQWDPDHAPNGAKEARRALQIGLRGATLQTYGREAILSIEDISDFVAEQRAHLGDLSRLCTPAEQVYRVADETIAQRLGLD